MRTVENIWNVKIKKGNGEKVVFLYVNVKRAVVFLYVNIKCATHNLKLLTVPMIFLFWRR